MDMSTLRPPPTVVFSATLKDHQLCLEAKVASLEAKVASLESEELDIVEAARNQQQYDAGIIARLKVEKHRLEQLVQSSREQRAYLEAKVTSLEAEKRDGATSAQTQMQAAMERVGKTEAEACRLRELLGMEESQITSIACRRSRCAVRIQRSWRRHALCMRRGRIQREKARMLIQKKINARLAAFQQIWRIRRERLRRRREQFEQGFLSQRRPTTKYDVIVSFESLSEFITSGRIDLLQAAQSLFDVAQAARYRIVAVVGLFDKGKTFLINRLLGVNLPAGKLFTTKGLSFLWVKERRMLVLDSAGVQATVSYRAQAVQPILDAQTTESLIFEMVSRIAHHMIFVVNDLTWFEQKYVAMLHQKYVKSRQAKELIVVHNLRTTSYVEEARQLFKRQIMQCYEGEPSHLGDLVFTADHGPNVPHVHHIGICDEATVAGEKFNNTNCAILLQMLEIRDMLGSNVVLSDLLRGQFEQLLPKFVSVEPIEQKTLVKSSASLSDELQVDNSTVEVSPVGPILQAPESRVAVEYMLLNSEAGDDGYMRAGSLVMQTTQPGFRLAMKTRGVISSLGEIIAHDVSFEPTVNVYDRRGEQYIKRYIEIECPKVIQDDIDWEELANGIKITIRKHKAIDEMSVHPVYPIRQHHGVWEREFQFESTEGRFEICPDEFNLQDGVLLIVLLRPLQARKGKLGRGTQLGIPKASQNTELSTSL